jgi:hypothetical protein
MMVCGVHTEDFTRCPAAAICAQDGKEAKLLGQSQQLGGMSVFDADRFVFQKQRPLHGTLPRTLQILIDQEFR